MKVLICGGRTYGTVIENTAADRARARYEGSRFYSVMEKLDADAHVTRVIESGAKGADRLARDWAEDKNIPVHTFKADWEGHGSFAGPLRNKQMLDEGQPDLVVAFPGKKGTANMCKLARAAGIEVIEIAP